MTSSSGHPIPVVEGAEPIELWPCGCVPNGVAEHGGECKEVPGRTGIGYNRRVHPGELAEIEVRARRGQMIPPAEVLALVRTINAMIRRVVVRFNETAQARQEVIVARDHADRAERELGERGPKVPGDQTDLRRILSDRQARIDELEQRLEVTERELKRYRSGHVCVEGCKPNAHVAFQGRHRLAELETQVDKIRQRFGIGASADLYDALCRKVGDLQTSEAELVSAPLVTALNEAQAQVIARDGNLKARDDTIRRLQERLTGQQVTAGMLEARHQVNADLAARVAELTERERVALAQKEAAEHRAARAARRLEDEEVRHIRTRDELAKIRRQATDFEQMNATQRTNLESLRAWSDRANRRIADLERSVEARNGLLSEAATKRNALEAELAGMQIVLDDWTKAGEKIAALVTSNDVGGAIEYDSHPPDMERSWRTLVETIEGVRAAIPRMVEDRDA